MQRALPRERRAARREELPDGVRWHHPSGQATPAPDLAPEELGRLLRREAEAIHLPRLFTTDLRALAEDHEHLRAWLDAGYGDGLSYLRDGENPSRNPRAFPEELLQEAKTAIVVAVPYSSPTLVPLRKGPREPLPLQGQVAAYAGGVDYHHVLKDRLLILGDVIADLLGRPVLARAVVDTAAVLERALAKRSRLGFVGKNTMLIRPGDGSHFLLGELFVDAEIVASAEPVAEGCGRCEACLTACPTEAFVGPYLLDARRCVSYQTIENLGEIPRELRRGVGTRVFGCDECQSACPYNQTAHKRVPDPLFRMRPVVDPIELEKLLFLGSAAYRTLTKGTALRRAGREQLSRNAAVALGNTGNPAAIPLLLRAIREHSLALPRLHAAWALGRLAFEFELEGAKSAFFALLDEVLPEDVTRELAAWLPGAAPSP